MTQTKPKNIEKVNHAVLRFTIMSALQTAHFLGRNIGGQADEILKALEEQEFIKGIDNGDQAANS